MNSLALLSDMKVQLATVKWKPDAQHMLTVGGKCHYSHRIIVQSGSSGITEQIEPDGVLMALPVAWQNKNDGSLQLCADDKVCINDKIMTECNPLPHTETLLSHNE